MSHVRHPSRGGDVLLLGPGVVAVGVGERTTPAGAEALARSLFDDDLAHTVLAVPIRQERAQMHLDTVCTMVDVDAVVMYPNVVHSLSAFTIHRAEAGIRIDDEVPFVQAAADAMGIEQLRVIDTGLDPVTAEREQWDDGNNTLALAPGVVVAYERNSETNARLADSGIEVLPIEASELGTGRGGPRCMSCPAARDALALGSRCLPAPFSAPRSRQHAIYSPAVETGEATRAKSAPNATLTQAARSPDSRSIARSGCPSSIGYSHAKFAITSAR